MNKVIITGPGNSGSGAILDFLNARNDTFDPFNTEEFRLVNDPGGISSLEHGFYDNFGINNSADVYSKFNKFCEKLIGFKNRNNENVYPENFEKIFIKFSKDILDISYNGLPRFQRFNLSLNEKIKFYILRIIFKKNLEDINMFKMVIPVEKINFIQLANKFIDEIISSSKNYSENKIAIIDQALNIFDVNNQIKYFTDAKCILTIRDPIGTFYTISELKKNNIALAYQGLNVEKFVIWYAHIYKKIESINFDQKKVLVVKFEDFCLKHDEVSKEIFNFLNIKNLNSNFNIANSLKNVEKIEEKINKKDLEYIKLHLNDFIKKY